MNDSIRPINRLLVANRGEIAIRVMRAATGLGITTVAVHTYEDRMLLLLLPFMNLAREAGRAEKQCLGHVNHSPVIIPAPEGHGIFCGPENR